MILCTCVWEGGSDGKDPCAMQETQVPSLVQEDLMEKGMQTTPVFLPGECNGQKTLAGYFMGSQSWT